MSDIEFLQAVVAYIEEWEVDYEDEQGINRSLVELIAAGEMPALYTEALQRLNAKKRLEALAPPPEPPCPEPPPTV